MADKKMKTMTGAELSGFCGQVAMILEAGLPLYDGMETLAGMSGDDIPGTMVKEASRRVTETGSLYEALKADERWPSYLAEMAGIGERSGQLEQVMRGLERFYAREDRIRSSVKSAVAYPLTLGIMLAVIVFIMLWKVLPVFRNVLAGMGMGSGGGGGALMRLGTALGWVVLVIVIAAAVLVGASVLLLRTKHADRVRNVLFRLFPSIRRISEKMSASRVAGVLSMMLAGGLHMEEALERASAVIDDRHAAAEVDRLRSNMESGMGFADALGETSLFGDMESRMLKMAGAAGQEERTLRKIGDQYEEQAESDIERLIGVIEPSLVAVLCVVIGAVLLTVMLPMAGILSSL